MNEKQRYIITTAQSHARLNETFYYGLKHYAKQTNGQLLFLPTFGESASERNNFPYLKGETFVDDRIILNDSLEIQIRRIRPQMMDPLTGLNYIVKNGRSVIFESPQIRYRSIASDNMKYAKFLITTGAVTIPNYATKDDSAAERQRLGLIAKDNHMYGAVIVDIVSPTLYHFRHVQANGEGTFVDLGTSYTGNKTAKSKLEALVIGDWHNGYVDPKNKAATFDMIARFKPKNVILHDFFNGHSVCHHMDDELIYSLIREGVDKRNLNLGRELTQAGTALAEIAAQTKGTVYLAASNHHEFLNRWLDEGRFVKNPTNAKLGFQLAQDYANGLDPVKTGIERCFGELPANIVFLDRDASLKVRGHELAKHGDKGGSGGRGSIKEKEYLYGKSITGHVHGAERYHNTHTVGTMQRKQAHYMKGSPSRWTATNDLLWDNGTVQALNIINGEYML